MREPARARLSSGRRGDHDHLVEATLAAHLVQERHLDHADRRRLGHFGEALAKTPLLADHARVQDRLQVVEILGMLEHPAPEYGAVDLAGARHNLGAEAVLQPGPDRGVGSQQLVHHLVTGERGCAQALEQT